MLNKGPYLVTAVSVLADILTRMQAHHEKKRSMLLNSTSPLAFRPPPDHLGLPDRCRWRRSFGTSRMLLPGILTNKRPQALHAVGMRRLQSGRDMAPP
jgi:hypothetical protein